MPCDTHADADRMQLALLRRSGPDVVALSRAALRRYGEKLAAGHAAHLSARER